jgi:predicted kinase
MTLIVLGGLPATGKSTVAAELVRRTGFPYLRIDTIEQTIVRTTSLRQPLGVVGYAIGYALAAEQVRHNVSVIVECVNPLAVTRDAWQDVAVSAGARLVEVELVCPDRAAHQRRVDTRVVDIPDLVHPTWQEIVDRDYEPWTRDHLVVDTATHSPAEAADLIMTAIPEPRPQRSAS